MSNFICPTCNKEFTIIKHFSKGGKNYDYKWDLLVCDCEEKTELQTIPKTIIGTDTPPAIGKYRSASREEKRKILKERSHQHFKKEILPVKKIMDKGL